MVSESDGNVRIVEQSAGELRVEANFVVYRFRREERIREYVGRYRYRLLAKSVRNFDLSSCIRAWLARGPKPKGNLKLEVDIDPQSFL